MPSTLHILFNIYSNLYNKPHNTHYITVTVCFVFRERSMHRIVLIIVII